MTDEERVQTCPYCEGADTENCRVCKGSGQVRVDWLQALRAALDEEANEVEQDHAMIGDPDWLPPGWKWREGG